MALDLPLDAIHVPPGTEPPEPAPTAVLLHGRGADEEDLLPVARELPGDRHVIGLRAPNPLRGGYTWYELGMPDGDLHRSQPDAEEFRRSLDLVADAVSAARGALPVGEVGLLGFSQGAIAGLALAVEGPTRFEWVAALHGYLADSHADRGEDAAAGVPVFVSAGRRDGVIPERRSEAAAEGMEATGADVTYRTYDAGHGIGPEELSDVAEFVGAAER